MAGLASEVDVLSGSHVVIGEIGTHLRILADRLYGIAAAAVANLASQSVEAGVGGGICVVAVGGERDVSRVDRLEVAVTNLLAALNHLGGQTAINYVELAASLFAGIDLHAALVEVLYVAGDPIVGLLDHAAVLDRPPVVATIDPRLAYQRVGALPGGLESVVGKGGLSLGLHVVARRDHRAEQNSYQYSTNTFTHLYLYAPS